ncbi:inner membrane-spanning protein YciB [Vitreimonas flagellata]|uniref:inner membrane-spanning protein YciB n=1 Tax=Vitreimonas flagellata TaxID=2560861 RepID=UPI001431F6A2|nr:inner membrane-spanning protein YciB [Vitreimonas flagellata]
MTEELTPLATAKPKQQGGPNQLLIDLGPVIIYVVAFNVLQRIEATKENAVYIATGIFMAATIAAIAWCKIKQGRIPPVLIITGVIVTAFGGLTIALHDPTFIQIKPTFTYLFYVAAVLGSLAIRQNVWKLLFGHAFNLPDKIWTILALRWSAFFAFQAVLNEVIRNTQTFEFWLNSRPFIVFPLTILFAVLNTPIVLKHQREEPETAAETSQGA